MVREDIFAKLKQTWHKQTFSWVDNLKQDLVADPSSFRMAMSFSKVCGFQSLWMLIDATLNVSSAVSPSFKGRFDTRISANVPNWVDPPGLPLEGVESTSGNSVCLSSLLMLFPFFQTLSSGESRNLSHGIQCHYGLRPIERGQFRFFHFCMKISLSLSNSMIFSRSPLLKTRKNC